jgi:two-component system, cell cycle sensor histidine kinase and response regulator CckA
MSGALATTLVVDDEEMVRRLIHRMLDPEVCRVVEAEDGETALRLIQLEGSAIDVVLTDLVMPGIDGFDIVHVLAENCPDLPVVCMSGFVTQAAAGRGLMVPFVPKPFTLDALRGAITPLIARSQEARRKAEATRDRAAQGGAAAVDLVAAALVLRRQRADGESRG